MSRDGIRIAGRCLTATPVSRLWWHAAAGACLAFLISTSPAGAQDPSFTWVGAIGGTHGAVARSVAPGPNGNIYLLGSFEWTADMDPGDGTYELTSTNFFDKDIFVVALDGAGRFLWARRMGGPGDDAPGGITVDHDGNVYTVGSFQGIADFDPGDGTYELTGDGGSDVFVSKLDSAGNFVWAKRLGGALNDTAWAVASDGGDHIVVVGGFTNTADFDPGDGVFDLTSASNDPDGFIAKVGGDGHLEWAKRIGGPNIDYAVAAAIGSDGSVTTVGFFSDTIDADPGPGTLDLTAAGWMDVFVCRLDGAGNLVWARGFGGDDADIPTGVALDETGAVYIAGRFGGTVDFDPGPGASNLTSVGLDDVFVSKLDTSGSFVWARGMGGVSTDLPWGIAVDRAHHVYTTGAFSGSADFDPGAAAFPLTATSSESDGFVSKLDAAGRFLWAKQLGGGDFDEGVSMALDGNGDLIIAGLFQETVDFDPGSGTVERTASTDFTPDAFVLKWSRACGESDADGDGFADLCDDCPDIANASQEDSDFDDVGDACDVCPSSDDPGQIDTDGDGTGDACSLTVTRPVASQILDCSDPAHVRPTIAWSPGAYDRYVVVVGSNPSLFRGTVTSGDKALKVLTWTPSASKWKRACAKALAANPAAPVLYVRVRGTDKDVPKTDPARTGYSSTVQIGVTP